PHPALHSFPTRRSSDLLRDLPSAELAAELERLAPSELLYPEGAQGVGRDGVPTRALPPWQFDADTAVRRLTAQLGTHDLAAFGRSEEHTSELQSLAYLVCRLLLEKKK